MPRDDHISLLALCRIKRLSWHLIAREAMRPDGLARLLRAELTEDSKEANEAQYLIEHSLPELPKLRDEVEQAVLPTLRDGVRLATVLDDDYPLNLRGIYNPPPFLFCRGTLLHEEDARSLAVVGTREPTARGLAQARKMASLLAQNRVTVLSGLARGIDTAAHEAVLNEGGRTIAVVGTGIRRVYPRENSKLAVTIAEQGAVVSQFWPDQAPAKYTFPRRNVTMSGLGQGTVVIEASATSGAKMQARLALDHGKKVFLLKSLVEENAWAKRYLERGAHQVSNIDDILNELNSPEQIRLRTEASQQLSLGLL